MDALLIGTIAIGLFGLGWLAARVVARHNSDPVAKGQLTFPGTYTQAFQRSLDILAALDASLQSADANRGTLVARVSPTLAPLSVGGTLRIAITTQEGLQYVYLEAASPLNPVKRGAGQGMVDRFMEVWDRMATS
jgi:hypothetical protein